MAQFDVGPWGKRFLNPELFQFHLSAFLYLFLIFSALIAFHFHGTSRPGVLKFYFCAQLPAFPEVVAQIDDGMRDVETPVAGVIFIQVGLSITILIITVEVARIGHLTVSA